ncbi:MAG: prepilin-type N-terminal cleavage/methylation domain-containing protein [Candidatus Saccharibacteria bacterium]
MKKTTSGFTLIELIIVIIVIGILSTIGIFSFSGVQVKSRDAERSSKAVIITESLEKYYDSNGAYPDCDSLKTEDVTTNVLKGITKETLVTPKSTAGINSITCDEAQLTAQNDVFAYVYNNGNFSFKYIEESTGNIITINNRRSAIASYELTTEIDDNIERINPDSGRYNTGRTIKITAYPAAPYFSFDRWEDCSAATTATIDIIMDGNKNCKAFSKAIDNESPLAPSIIITESGTDIIATIAPVTCKTGLAQYSIRSKKNDDLSWSNYSVFSNTTIYSQPSNQGYKYYYQAKSRCYSSEYSTTSKEAEGAVAEYIKLISRPTMANINVSTSGNNTTWTWDNVSCPINTNTQYWYYYSYPGYTGADAGWTVVSKSDSSKYPIIKTTTTGGYRYTVTALAQCLNSFADSGFGDTKSASYDRPSTPNTPAVTVIENGTNIQATISAVTCAVGSPEYQISYQTNDGVWGGYSAFGATTVFSQTSNQGYKYIYKAQSRCYSYTTATSGGISTSAEVAYIKPINKPAAPTVTTPTTGASTTWQRTDISCPTGTTKFHIYSFSYYGYNSDWQDSTTNSITFTTAAEGNIYTVSYVGKCYNIYADSGWSDSGSKSYTQPVSIPAAPSNFTVARYPAGDHTVPVIARVTWSSSCSAGTTLYSQIDINSLDFKWHSTTRTETTGWYSAFIGAAWMNTWGSYGTTIVVDVTSNTYDITDGSRYKMALELQCRNTNTGINSAVRARTESDPLGIPH